MGPTPTQRFERWDFTFAEALNSGQCVLCFGLHQTVTRYLEALFYENVNDPPTRTQLRAAWGFCPRHMEDMLATGDVLGGAILTEDWITTLIALSPGHLPATTPCPACVMEEDALVRYQARIDQWAKENPSAQIRLCWPHLRNITQSPERISVQTANLLWSAHHAQWLLWVIQLRTAAHADYQSSPSPATLATWRQVAKYLAGHVPLPLQPPPF